MDRETRIRIRMGSEDRLGWRDQEWEGTGNRDDWRGEEGHEEEGRKSSRMRDHLVGSDLVDLRLQVLDHLLGHLVAQDLKQVDALVSGDRLVRSQLDAFLHVLDLGVTRDQVRVLCLTDRLVRERGTLSLGIGHSNAHNGHDQSTHESHFHFRNSCKRVSSTRDRQKGTARINFT